MHAAARPVRLAVFSWFLVLFAAGSPGRAADAPAPPPIDAGSALLFVVPPAAPGPDADALYQRRINTHVATLRSGQHVHRTLTNPNSDVRKTQWFRTSDDPRGRIEQLKQKLRATAVPGTSLIEVALDAPEIPAEDRRTILYELCSNYLDGRKNVQVNQLLDQTAVLNNVKIKAEMRLKDLMSEMREKQIKLNLDGGGVGRIGTKELELSRLVGEQVEAQLKAAKAKGAYDAAVAAVEQGHQDFPAIERYMTICNPYLGSDAYLLQQTELERDLALQAKGKDDPASAALAARAEKMRQTYIAKRDEARAKAKAMMLEEMAQEVMGESARLETLTKRVDNLKQDIGELSNAMVSYTNLHEEQKGLREQLAHVRQQIEQVLSRQSSTQVSDIQWHMMPEVPQPTR